MPRIIVSSRFLKSGTSCKRGGLVKYIATRESVEMYSPQSRGIPVTKNQTELIQKLLAMFPEEKMSHEYEDYHSDPTKENASELISELLERNADRITDRKMLVKYISERPGVAKIGKHGLFTSTHGEVKLSDAMKTIANHEGNVWTHVVSLKREDAERLGYVDPESWRSLVLNNMKKIAEAQRIEFNNLRWFAAFHNTAHHPHIHLLVYSTDPKEGYLTTEGIEMIKSAFANEIFSDELNFIYKQQTRVRNDLRAEAKRKMQELSAEIQDHLVDPQLEALILKLSRQLENAKGKKVYGYLQPQVKKTVDDIVAMLAADPTIKKMYDEWCRLEQEKYATYTNAVKQFPPLQENDVFKPIRNSVINAVLEMSHTLGSAECDIREEDALPEPEMNAEPTDDELPDEDMVTPSEETPLAINGGYYAKWIDEYREARNLIWSEDSDYAKAYELLKPEADDGNVLAIYELAKMYARGFLGEDNKDIAKHYYKTALEGFIEVEQTADKMKPFFQYRIGAMYNYSQGTEQNYTEAFKWFQSSATAGNPYAMFALGNLYNYGKGVDKDVTKAFEWYKQSADKKNPYAAYMTARMLQNGTGTEKNAEQAEEYYKKAYEGFRSMEENTKDGDLLYKLGIMTTNGIGCEADKNAGAEYLRRGAELKNAHAMCEYGKLLVEGKTVPKDTDRGIAMLDEAAVTNENARYYLGKVFLKGEYVYPNPELAIKLFHTCESPYAQYALGKIYLDGRYAAKNLVLAEKHLKNAAEHELDFAEYALGKLYLDDSVRRFDLAEEYLNRAAGHGNEFAMYRLAKLYLSGNIPLNTEKAVELLQKAADKLSTAAYALGKLYLFGREIPQDRELAVYWLTRASDMGNEFAQHLLEHIDSFDQSRVQNAFINMLLAFVRLLNENYNRTDRNIRMHTDKKLRAAIHRKKQALGIKEDHTIQQNQG